MAYIAFFLRKRNTCAIIVIILFLGAISFSATFYALQYYHSSAKQTDVSLAKKDKEQPVKKTLPHRLRIPVIGIDAEMQSVGLTVDGAMEVPTNKKDVGWYRFGPKPGEKGSAVIAGHYDGEYGEKGVFEKLHLLKENDLIYVEDSGGEIKSFIVRESRIYDPKADSSAVFSLNDGNHLNLITCDGIWDSTQKSYSNCLVIFTDAIL